MTIVATVGGKRKPNIGRPRIKGWSIKYKACKACGTDDKGDPNNHHHGQGYCFRCYHREWAGEQPKLLDRERIRLAEADLESALTGELKALRAMYKSFVSDDGKNTVHKHIRRVEDSRLTVSKKRRALTVLKKEAKSGGD